MALKIYYDLQGNYITEPALSVVDSLTSRDQAQLSLDGAWVAPGGLGITLEPVQVTPGWATAGGKLALSDFLHTAALWEQVDNRADGDHFALSRGAASEALVTAQPLNQNQGLWAEFFAYGVPHALVRDLMVLSFGGHFRLHVHSDGTADLEDLHPVSGTPGPVYVTQARPLTAGAGDLSGRFVQIGILPWRRGRILVWSNLGASFEAYVGERRDASASLKPSRTPGQAVYHVTTEQAQAVLDFSLAQTLGGGAAPLRAFGTLNTLTYPLAGSASSPAITLPYRVSQPPAARNIQAEQQDGTRAALVLTDGAGDAFAPSPDSRQGTLRYRIDLTTPDASHTPVVFGAHIDFDRQTGDRTYDTDAIGSPQSARLTVSRDRSQKSFSFTLDNPGEQWTSLKDFWNRQMEARIEADGIDGQSTVVFYGLTDPADFLDGVASKITVPCSGLRKRLRSCLLSDARAYDGFLDTDTVRDVLHQCGVSDDEMVIYDAGGTVLDGADPGEDPLWRPANGVSADEFIQHLCDTWSGWVFDDIGGKYYYVPREYFTGAAIQDNAGVPEILVVTPLDDITGLPLTSLPPAETDPTAPPGDPSDPAGGATVVIVALADSVRQSAEEPRANDIWVLGRDAQTGEVVSAHYEDVDGIQNRVVNGQNNPRFVGERRILVYASASITSLATAQTVCGVLAERLTQPVVTVSLSLPDFRWQELPLEGPVYLHGYGYGLVVGFDGEWSNDRFRLTAYQVELLPAS